MLLVITIIQFVYVLSCNESIESGHAEGAKVAKIGELKAG